MTQEEIGVYTRRIAASNRTELICVLFDIFESNATEAQDLLKNKGDTSFNEEQQSAYVHALRQCGQVARHLKDALDFTYPIARELFPLYDYVERVVAKAMYRQNPDEIAEARHLMHELGEAFATIAKEDASAPVMSNAQQVAAGLTYGRDSLNETLEGSQVSRGYWA